MWMIAFKAFEIEICDTIQITAEVGYQVKDLGREDFLRKGKVNVLLRRYKRETRIGGLTRLRNEKEGKGENVGRKTTKKGHLKPTPMENS